MTRAWQCRTCEAHHVPEDDLFSWWKCSICTALRWRQLPWIGGAALGVGLVMLIAMMFSGNSEATFSRQVQHALQSEGAMEGILTPEERKTLAQLARRLRLAPERTEALIMQKKRDYLSAKQATRRQYPPGHDTITAEEWVELCGLATAMGLASEVSECQVTSDTILSYLRQGEFAEAKKQLDNLSDAVEKARLEAILNTPLRVEVKFQYQKGTTTPSAIYALDTAELQALHLTHRDNYRLFLSAPSEQIYVYAFQQDQYGQITRLFPDPVWSQAENPIRAGITYRIPPGEKEWLYLDELPPAQETAIQEVLYIIATPWQAEDIDQLYGDLHRAPTQARRNQLRDTFLQRLRFRADETINASYYAEFAFKHEG